MNQAHHILHLRELLHQAPSPEVWAALWHTVESWGGIQSTLALDYLREHLDHWPDNMRSFPSGNESRYQELWREHAPHPMFPFLRSLQLRCDHLGEQTILPCLRHPSMSQIRVLRIISDYKPLSHQDLRQIANNEALSSLHTLILDDNQIEQEGLKLLLRSPHIEGLRCLSLSHNQIGQSGAQLLAALAPPLEELDLSANDLGTRGARHLFSSTRLQSLKTLRLSWNHIGQEDHIFCPPARRLPKLQELDLSFNQIGPIGLHNFLVSGQCRSLRTLSLDTNLLGPDGFSLLLDHPDTEQLHTLNMRANDLQDQGAELLLRAPKMPSLMHLDLSLNSISSENRERLSQHPRMQALSTLRLCHPLVHQDAPPPLGAKITPVHAAATTGVGPIRQNNEDAFLLCPPLQTYAVFDGMGGNASGAFTSQLLAAVLAECSTPPDPETGIQIQPTTEQDIVYDLSSQVMAEIKHEVPRRPISRLSRILEWSNKLYTELTHHNDPEWLMYQGTASCFVLAQTTHRQLLLAHIGNCRAYRIREGSIQALTQDHSLINELKAAQIQSEFNVEALQHIVTRAFGIKQSLQVDYQRLTTMPGDLYLLCSDGLYEALDEQTLLSMIEEHLHQLTLREICDQLLQAAENAGSQDNITALLLAT